MVFQIHISILTSILTNYYEMSVSLKYKIKVFQIIIFPSISISNHTVSNSNTAIFT